ncbi:MAG TPA: cation-translocating P-type ATPase [Bacteroidia bacterium]|jgi:Cu+-exporting ATPase
MSKDKKVTLQIEGMDCNHCAVSISRTIEKRGLKDVNVNFATGEGSFVLPGDVRLDSVINDIEKLGYHAHEPRAGTETPAKGLSSIEKKFLFALIFTLPLLLHMVVKGGPLAQAWVQFAICLPVFTLGTLHFGKSAWGSLRAGMPNMDVLIVIGSSAAFYYSLAGTIMYDGMDEVHHYLFYETCASIITLVLLGNVLEHRSVKQTTTAIKELSALQITKARRVAAHGDHEHLEEIDALSVKAGDLLQVNTGDRIPVDGVIISGTAGIDESMITGESLPVQRSMGQNVVGGTILLEGNFRMLAEHVGKETVLSKIIEMVKNAQNQKPSIQRLGDKVSAIFVPAVLLISVLTFFIARFAFGVSNQASLMQSIAVLVISCPCAMGLATPTAVMVGIGRAARNGILIKGGSTLEQLTEVKQVVFDKTGTLTTGKFSIKSINATESNMQEAVNVLYFGEQRSSHPIARSVVKLLQEKVKGEIRFTSAEEIKGTGLELKDDKGNLFRIGSARVAGPGIKKEHDIYVMKNDVLLATVDIEDELKENISITISKLKKQGITPILLSGDSRSKCEMIAQKTGIEKIFSEQNPRQKLEVMDALMKQAPTAMVGDGINDGPALARASVGISIGNASQVAIQSAQVVLLRATDLSQLPETLRIAKHTLITIKQNLFWAFFYNVVAIPIAACGFLNPMIGALAMAFSDVIVIGNSIRLKTKRI